MKGRKPKSTTEKIKEGNPGKRKLNKPIEYISDLPSPPDHLDAYAIEEWDRISHELHNLGLLYDLDMAAFAAYCSAYSRWKHAEEELNKLKATSQLNALVIKTASGNWIQQPLIGIANKAASDMVRYAAEGGITRVARSRLELTGTTKPKSKFDGLVLVQGGKK